MLHASWRLVGHIKNVANRFAEACCVTLAPGLHEGKTVVEPDEAGSLMMALNISEAEQQLRGGVKALLAEPATEDDRVGVVGFCMGGQLSMFTAAIDPEIGAFVNFYCIHPNVHPPLKNLRAPILGLVAEQDAYASPESVAALSAQFSGLDRPHEFHTFAGTQHAFFKDERPQVYDPTAVEDAWRRTLESPSLHPT